MKITKDKGKEELTFTPPRRILMIRKDSMLNTYRQLGKQMDEKLLPSESILHYLQNTPEYYGRAVSPERFKSFNSNGQPIQELMTEGGTSKLVTKLQQDRPLCFDYTLVSEKFGINPYLSLAVCSILITKQFNCNKMRHVIIYDFK
jgi:hypothetical protein